MSTIPGLTRRPQSADWCATLVYVDTFGETDYVTEYGVGALPDVDEFLDMVSCKHGSWVAGMMYVHPEDLISIAATGRPVECEYCGVDYFAEGEPAYDWSEYECRPTPQGAHSDADPVTATRIYA